MDETQISRVTRSKADAQASYDRLSRWYDLFDSSERAHRDAALKMLDVKPGERVLEIGFGTGHSIATLARSVGAAGKVYGIDLSEGMRRIAQARIDAAGLASRVSLQCGDATRLPFEDDCFDAIFMSFTLELFDTPEIPIVLRECRRVLRAGGRLGVVAMSKPAKPSWALRLYEWAHRTLPALVDCRPIFVQRTLEEEEFQIADATPVTLWGLPGEILVATSGRTMEVRPSDF